MSIAETTQSSEMVSRGHKPAQRGFKFHITMEGAMLLLVIILIGFAAWHSGTNLLYLIFSILVAMYLLHGFMLSLNLLSLTASEDIPATATARQPIDITVSLHNNKRFFASSAIRLSHMLDNKKAVLGNAFFPQIPAKSSRDAYYTVVMPQRGLHTILSVGITTRYPFGFEERTQFRGVEKQILVLPPAYNVSSVAADIPSGFGDQESTVRGTGTELYGLREYVPGEHARHVHWRTSIRAQKIMVAEFFREERRQIMLVLDNGVATKSRKTVSQEFENAIILTASLARHLISTGYEVGLITGDSTIPYSQGSSQLTSILRHLALLQLKEPTALTPPPATAVEIRYQFTTQGNTGLWPVIDSTKWRPPTSDNLSGAATS